MDVEELQCLPYIMPVTKPFAVSWSEDDCASIMTPKGIYVLVLKPVPHESLPLLDFKRYWIPVPQKIPTDKLGIDPNEFVHKLEKDDVYNLVTDVSLSPGLESIDNVLPHPVQVAWSPRGLLQYGRCVLATLTHMGLVNIHILRNKQWITIFDFSDELIKHLKSDWKDYSTTLSQLKPYEQYLDLKKRVYQVKTLAIGWSPIFDVGSTCYSYCVTGQANGDIVIWKISSMVDESFLSEPKIVLITNVNLKRMTCISWYSMRNNKGIILAGDHNGLIKLFDVMLDQTNPDKVDVQHLADIWPESDNIAVKKVECLGEGPNLSDRCFIAIKGNFLILISVGDDGTLLDRSSLHMPSFNIVGCVCLEKFSLVLSTQQGNMTKVDISKANNGKITFEVQELKSNIDMSEKLCFGVVASTNKMIWMMVNSVYKPYDHLVLRDPTMAVIFTFNFLPNPLTVLKNNPQLSLTSFWDCLEIFRILLFRGRKFDIEMKMENLYSRHTYELCCSLWTLSIYSKFVSQEADCPKELITKIKNLEDAIFLQHSCKVLRRLLSSDLKALTDVQLLSFSLFYKWMKIFVEESEGEDMKQFQSLLESVAKKDDFLSSIPEETCFLCKESVKMKYWKTAECDAVLPNKGEACKVKGHCIPRCSLSLIQCLTLPYRICFFCSALANGKLVHEEEPICIFCNGIMNLDDRIFK